jgi:hypothetical protein
MAMTPRSIARSKLVLAAAIALTGMAACKQAGKAGKVADNVADKAGKAATAATIVAAAFTEFSPAKGDIPTGKYGRLTTAEAVLEAAIAALGGRERQAKLKAGRTTARFTVPGDKEPVKGTIEEIVAAPRSKRTTIDVPGIRKVVSGVTGDLAWEVSSTDGPRIVTGAARTEALREATFNPELKWKELFPKVELAGVFELGGTPAYQVVLTPPEGDPEMRYFATDTLLMVGTQSTSIGQDGKTTIEATYSDWREVDGIQYAFKVRLKTGLEMIIEKVEHDPPLDPAVFALPPEVEALVKKQP